MQFHAAFKTFALATALAAVLATPAMAQVRERTFKIGTGITEDHPQARASRHLDEVLAARSGGKMRAKPPRWTATSPAWAWPRSPTATPSTRWC
ncbi:hypothetical protein [Paracidovorax cattleyae]|uniref:Uncharacterized protein n=1 Tax=Paracidovorax cattleyae TaxID=80868 RepID=A0A1H0QNX7_9BURK|nr:hypothetical protein [Paracidovorax cattleyae]SDP18449.1 hypothetical protein SAMN04489708_108177 [Paracidovorax cattleyae]